MTHTQTFPSKFPKWFKKKKRRRKTKPKQFLSENLKLSRANTVRGTIPSQEILSHKVSYNLHSFVVHKVILTSVQNCCSFLPEGLWRWGLAHTDPCYHRTSVPLSC